MRCSLNLKSQLENLEQQVAMRVSGIPDIMIPSKMIEYMDNCLHPEEFIAARAEATLKLDNQFQTRIKNLNVTDPNLHSDTSSR
jgi:hypothetical protein